ncbi:unnamed protein product [Vicia faba]|uniref:E3 ubiquitin-protein ligase listerin n=1 Tax=Vicia faba TaxID=3906 RepID=A0AAV0YUE2_VICFA|nr:unnamed protein product [Vicia faba]
MTSLVNAVGRDLASHLKTLMGPWWFARFDPAYEVSQAAKSLSDKAVAVDELKEMYRQEISSMLLALASLLDVLIFPQQEQPASENITTEPKHASRPFHND